MLSANQCRCFRGLRRIVNHEEHEGTRSRILFYPFVNFVSFVVISGERTRLPACVRAARPPRDGFAVANALEMTRSAGACSSQKTSRTPRAEKRNFIFSETVRIFSLCKK